MVSPLACCSERLQALLHERGLQTHGVAGQHVRVWCAHAQAHLVRHDGGDAGADQRVDHAHSVGCPAKHAQLVTTCSSYELFINHAPVYSQNGRALRMEDRTAWVLSNVCQATCHAANQANAPVTDPCGACHGLWLPPFRSSTRTPPWSPARG